MEPIRFFSSAADAPRARRPTDVVLCVVSIAAIATTAALAPDPKDTSTTAAFIQSLPGLFGWFWEIVHVLAIAWAGGITRRGALRKRQAIVVPGSGAGARAGGARGASCSPETSPRRSTD